MSAQNRIAHYFLEVLSFVVFWSFLSLQQSGLLGLHAVIDKAMAAAKHKLNTFFMVDSF